MQHASIRARRPYGLPQCVRCPGEQSDAGALTNVPLKPELLPRGKAGMPPKNLLASPVPFWLAVTVEAVMVATIQSDLAADPLRTTREWVGDHVRGCITA